MDVMCSATNIMCLQGSRFLYSAQKKKRKLEGNPQNMFTV